MGKEELIVSYRKASSNIRKIIIQKLFEIATLNEDRGLLIFVALNDHDFLGEKALELYLQKSALQTQTIKYNK